MIAQHAVPSPDVQGVAIRMVEDGCDLDRFVRLPFELHRDDPHWVPPLMVERRAALSRWKNPYFRHAEACFWLAERGGPTIGRISAQIDRLAARSLGDGLGQFGMLASIDDPQVVNSLLKAAESWLRERGMARVMGPFNLSINEETGLLVDGFDTPPMLMMGHDRRYLGPLLERAGYRKVKYLLAFLSDGTCADPLKPLLGRRLPPNVTVRPLRLSDYRREIATVTSIFNDAWSRNWGFVPMTEEEVDHMAVQMRPLIRERLVWFAEVDGEPAAMAVCLPNLNEMIRDLNGRLLPFGWAKLLWRLKRPGLTSGRVPLMGVRRRYADSLLGSMLAFLVVGALHREARAMGMRLIEMSWVLEDNMPMRRIAEALGGRAYKTYRIYGKAL
jgi:hypothetical protein